MDGEDVNLIRTDEPIDEPVRVMNDLANERILELRNRPTGLGESRQTISRRN